jgi:hypothetical protein
MPFDTEPGTTPIPILSHSISDCVCGHDDASHEAVESTVAGERTDLIVCLECDTADF